MRLSVAITAHLKRHAMPVTAAAKASGLSEPTIRRAMKGGLPYASTVPGFAKLLGMTPARVTAMVRSESKDRAANAPAPKQDTGPDLRECLRVFERAKAILGDELAVRVHDMAKRNRSAIAAVVQSLQ